MPSRISLPKLSLFSSRHSSSASAPPRAPPPPPTPTPTATATATATKTPRRPSNGSRPSSPPARLHLRNILPSSPEEPPMMPPPPRTPRAWVWQCHRCLTVYRLGCTRRCLDCSHTYCVSSAKPAAGAAAARGKKRRRDSGLCGAEFDYVGWEQWGSWRRKVLGFEAAGRSDPAARDRAFLGRTHDCWIDCDSPSECCHRRFELAAELHRTRNAVSVSAPAEQPLPPVVAGSRSSSPDDDISLDEALAPDEREKDGNGNGNGEEEKVPKSPKSPLGQSSFFWDDDDDDDDEDEDEEDDDDQAGKGGKRNEEEEAKKWWAARSKHESTGAPGTGFHNCASGTVDDDYDSGRAAKRVTFRKSGENTIAEDSDSDSESVGSGWSLTSSESDDSSVAGCAESK